MGAYMIMKSFVGKKGSFEQKLEKLEKKHEYYTKYVYTR